jgi:tricorn protease
VVYQQAGEIWLLESLDAEPVRLDIRLSGVRSGRASYPVSAKSHVGSFTLDSTGRVLGVEVRGTVHWLPGRDGPARALLAEAGVRPRWSSPARRRWPARRTTAAKTVWT